MVTPRQPNIGQRLISFAGKNLGIPAENLGANLVELAIGKEGLEKNIWENAEMLDRAEAISSK